MVYIASDGSVHQSRPWGFGRIVDIFWGGVNFVTQFFQTLFGFTGNAIGGGQGGSRGGGGGGGPGGPGGRGPRRMGTVKEIQDCSMPGGG